MDYVKENSKIWDDRSANADRWSVPVSSEETALARNGEGSDFCLQIWFTIII